MVALKLVSLSLAIAIAMVISPLESDATPIRISINSGNSSQFASISTFNPLNLKGACYFAPGSKSFIVGTLRRSGKIFRTAVRRDLRRAVGRQRLSSRHRRQAVRQYRKSARIACEKAQTNPPPSAPSPSTPIPQLNNWKSQMTTFGKTHCENLSKSNLSFDFKLASTYYDSQWVFYQIADYTGNNYWRSCAQAAEKIYRDQYAKQAGWLVPGYWIFTHGLAQDYLRTGDNASKTAAIEISKNAAFARDNTPLNSTVHVNLSREVAYSIMSYLNAEDVGAARRARLTPLVNQALGHMDQWFVHRNAPYIRPFMVALTSHALIMYHERTGDKRVLPAVRKAMDWLWANTWLPNQQAFMYTDRNLSHGGKEPAPDLNLLIAPAYAWLYHQTGEVKYRDRADQIFAGGVKNAWLNNGKQFNQNYRWSFDYIKWRSAKPLK